MLFGFVPENSRTFEGLLPDVENICLTLILIYSINFSVFDPNFSVFDPNFDPCVKSLTVSSLQANEVLLFNAKLTATEASDLGLVTQVFPDDQFQAQVWEKINGMAKLPKGSLRSESYSRVTQRTRLHESVWCFRRLSFCLSAI